MEQAQMAWLGQGKVVAKEKATAMVKGLNAGRGMEVVGEERVKLATLKKIKGKPNLSLNRPRTKIVSGKVGLRLKKP